MQSLQRGVKILFGIAVVVFLPWGIRQIHLQYYLDERNEQVVREMVDEICEKGYLEKKDYIDLAKRLFGEISDIEITEVIKREAREEESTYESVEQWEIEASLEEKGNYQFVHGSTLIVQIVLKKRFGRMVGKGVQIIRYVGRVKGGLIRNG